MSGFDVIYDEQGLDNRLGGDTVAYRSSLSRSSNPLQSDLELVPARLNPASSPDEEQPPMDSEVQEFLKLVSSQVATPNDLLFALCGIGNIPWIKAESGNSNAKKLVIDQAKKLCEGDLGDLAKRASLIDMLISMYPMPQSGEKFNEQVHLDINKPSTDGFSAAFCATVTCNRQSKTDSTKSVNECLTVLIRRGAVFIDPDEAKLTRFDKIFVSCYFIFLVGFYVMCFMLVITYSSYKFSINKSCDKIYKDIVLQPYGVIVLNTIFFKIFESSFKNIGNMIYFLYFKRYHDAEEKELREAMENEKRFKNENKGLESDLEDVNSDRADTEILFTLHQYHAAWKSHKNYDLDDYWSSMPYLFLYVQLIFAVVSFIIACFNISKDKTIDAWQQYTNFYGLIVNSCIPMTIFSIINFLEINGRMYQSKGNPRLVVECFYGGFCFLLVAPLCTHIIPAGILYCWVVLAVGLAAFVSISVLYCFMAPTYALAFCAGLIGRVRDNTNSETNRNSKLKRGSIHVEEAFSLGSHQYLWEYFEKIGTEILLRFSFVFFVQTLFCYATLVYLYPIPMTPQEYMGVITSDYHLRSQTLCFFNQIKTSGANGFLLIFSWL